MPVHVKLKSYLRSVALHVCQSAENCLIDQEHPCCIAVLSHTTGCSQSSSITGQIHRLKGICQAQSSKWMTMAVRFWLKNSLKINTGDTWSDSAGVGNNRLEAHRPPTTPKHTYTIDIQRDFERRCRTEVSALQEIGLVSFTSHLWPPPHVLYLNRHVRTCSAGCFVSWVWLPWVYRYSCMLVISVINSVF